LCYHEGITRNMIQAKREIIEMNDLVREKGWLI